MGFRHRSRCLPRFGGRVNNPGMIPVSRCLALGALALSLLVPRVDAATSPYVRASEAGDILTTRAALVTGISKAELVAAAKQDRDLYLTRSGAQPLYICKPARIAAKAAGTISMPRSIPRVPLAMLVGTNNADYIGGQPFDLPTTFSLHSRPGAARILYLDFDGHTTRGTVWNTQTGKAEIVSTPFDVDGDPANFGDEERAAIHEVWRRVAEDYAPFDVDVTTEEPPAVDLVYANGRAGDRWGIRMVIGGWATDVDLPQGVIGVAMLGSFKWPSDTPAFTFVEDILNFVPDGYAAEVAYTVSHEAGHTVGLKHDGDNTQEYYPGYPGWAPIMGSGDPTSTVQWSKGEYPFANNKEDDLARIASGYIPYIPLDHANSKVGVSQIASGDVAGGILINRNDTAWYMIDTGPGDVDIMALVSDFDPNLKSKLTLYKLDGKTVVAESDPNDPNMSGSLFATVENGTYYLVVDGTSWLTTADGFSDYDSIGRYFVGGTWPAKINTPPVASTAGTLAASGVAPLTVFFDGTASSDVDGIVTGYLWDFGDGTTSTLPKPEHTFALGSYDVTLTVTDNTGDTGSTTLTVSAIPLPKGAKTVSVSTMVANWVATSRTAGVVQCDIVMVDSSGRPMPNVDVTVGVSGLDTGVITARTDRTGKATFRSNPLASTAKGKVTFGVRTAVLAGYYYYPLNNKIKPATIGYTR